MSISIVHTSIVVQTKDFSLSGEESRKKLVFSSGIYIQSFSTC